REFNCKLSFVPAGHRFYGWQTPRVLTRVTYFYIDVQEPLFDPETGITCPAISPRLFFFDQAVWNTALKLKAEVGSCGAGTRQEPAAEAGAPGDTDRHPDWLSRNEFVHESIS